MVVGREGRVLRQPEAKGKGCTSEESRVLRVMLRGELGRDAGEVIEFGVFSFEKGDLCQ